MTDGLRKSHLRKAPQVGLSEVGLPDIYHDFFSQTPTMVTLFSCLTMFGGGVILTSCLTHMLPDVNEVVANF